MVTTPEKPWAEMSTVEQARWMRSRPWDELDRGCQKWIEHLDWRGVQDPCWVCCGSGVRDYGSTSTWRGGVGGQMITTDVCDHCWGTGDEYRHGADLRKLYTQLESMRRKIGIIKRKIDGLVGDEP